MSGAVVVEGGVGAVNGLAGVAGAVNGLAGVAGAVNGPAGVEGVVGAASGWAGLEGGLSLASGAAGAEGLAGAVSGVVGLAEAGSAGVPGAGYALHAALCAGAAAWLVVGRDRGLRRGRLLFAGSGVDGVRPWWGGWPRGARWDWRRVPREWGCLVVAGVAAALGESVLPLFAGAAAVPLAGRWLRRRERERARAKRAEGVVALCGAVTAELRAGREPGPALLAGVRDSGVLGAAEAGLVAAVRFGGDVPLALREAAREPGGEGLAGVAACWRVAVDGGAGLAEGLERLEGALRAELEQRAELRARLAGAWSTVVVLALLPAVGLLLGGALGAEPLRVLLHTPAGLGCLVVGAGLEAAGLWWAGRIVRRGAGDAG